MSGVILVLLGLRDRDGLIPLVEPCFGCAYTPGRTWAYTPGRLWSEVLPTGSVAVGGLLVLATRSRLIVLVGEVGAVIATWFTVGAIAVLAAKWVAVTSSKVSLGPRPRVIVNAQLANGCRFWHRNRVAIRPIPGSELARRSQRNGLLPPSTAQDSEDRQSD